MMLVMEQQNNLKEEIVSAVTAELRSFKQEIVQRMALGFMKQDLKIDKQFREQGVILEDIQDKVQLIVEGQDAIHQRIDRLHKRVTVLEER